MASSSSPPLDLILTSPSDDDLPRLAQIQQRAFHGSFVEVSAFGNVTPSAQTAHNLARISKYVKGTPEEKGRNVVTVAKRGQEIVGFSIWETAKKEGEVDVEAGKKEETKTEEEEREEKKKSFPEGTNVELAMECFTERPEEKLKEPHYHLHILVIDPSLQRTGAGAALLKWGLEKADEEGVPAVLESSHAGITLYKKYGFKDSAPPRTMKGEPALFPMKRQPAVTLSITTSPSDAPIFAKMFWDSFSPSTFFRSLYPRVDPAALQSSYSDSFSKALTDSEKNLFVVAKRGGKVVGFAEWWKPREGGFGRPEEDRGLPEGTEVELAKKFYKEVDDQIAGPQERHYSLQFIAVDPSLQRSGVGAVLLKHGLALAAEEGVPVRLEATEEGVKFYEAFGFKPSAPPIVAADQSFSVLPMILSPPLLLTPATPADCPRLGAIHHDAFKPHEVFRNLFPKVDRAIFITGLITRFEGVLATPGNEIIAAWKGREIVGFAYWAKTEKEGPGEKKEETPAKKREFAPGTNEELAKDFFEQVENRANSIPGAHYHLHILSVDPAAQRTGAGAALLQWGMKKAESEGINLYLDATLSGIPLYEKYGFVRMGEPIVAKDKSFQLEPMVKRPARPSAGKA